MERTREGWYEREEIKKVTLDWVDGNCKLTQREKELLPLIYDRKLVRRDHLEIISPSYRKLKNRTSLLNRAIKKLYKQMVLDKVHEKQEIGKGSNPAIVSIDKAGALILEKPFRKRIIHNKSKLKGEEYIVRRLPINYRHVNGVNSLEVQTILLCEEYGYELVMWELEQMRAFNYNNDRILLIPDVLMLLKINESYLVCFIEYDTGSEGLREKEPKVIEDKIIKYKRYKSSMLWENEEWQRYFSDRVFPVVLFATLDNKRINFVNERSKELGVQILALHSDNYRIVLERLIKIIEKKSHTSL